MKFNLKFTISLYLSLPLFGCGSGSTAVNSIIPQQCNPCIVYSATKQSNGFNGDLKSQATAMLKTTFSSGIAAADALCNSDESKPFLPSGAIYKALLVDGVNRGWNPTINWVIHSNTTYVNVNSNVIGISTESAILNFPTENSFTRSIGFVWSGLGGTSLQTLWQAGLDNCNGWSSSESSVYGNLGYEDYTNPTYALSSYQLFEGNTYCNQNQLNNLPIGLICIQQ